MSERKEKEKLRTLKTAKTETALLKAKDHDDSPVRSKTMRETRSATSSPAKGGEKKEKKDKKNKDNKDGAAEAAVESEQRLLLDTEDRPQCEAGTACSSRDPVHWVHFQHTPRSPVPTPSHDIIVRSSSEERKGNGRKTPRGGKHNNKSEDENDGSDVVGTVIIRRSGGGSGIHASGADDDDDDDDDDGSGTMVIRDEETLERLCSGDYEPATAGDGVEAVVLHSSRSEVPNSPRPWLNKYRSPETWERNIIALEKGEFTEDMNEEAFGKYVRNKPRPSAQQLFVQLSSPALPLPSKPDPSGTTKENKASKSAPSTPH